MKDNSYQAVMARSNEIMKKAIGMDYNQFERGQLAFDYQAMMTEAGYSLEEVIAIQKETGVGNTPLYELKNITKLARMTAPKGKGARIFLKDEASNPSGSFKARRAALAVYHAAKHGYKGVVAATSGNYGAAVASQAAIRGLKSIIVQEAFDSRGVYQPEIEEKGRACEAYGAECCNSPSAPNSFTSSSGCWRTLVSLTLLHSLCHCRGRDPGLGDSPATRGPILCKTRHGSSHQCRRRQPDRHCQRSAQSRFRCRGSRCQCRPQGPPHGQRPGL